MKHKGLALTGFKCFGTLLLCFIFCSTALCADARFGDGKSAIAIPFELDDNLIYVRVSVNGSRPLSFILDTGAHSIIHARHARSFGLKLKLIGQAGGIGANQPDVYLVTEKVSFSLPGVALSPRRLVAASLDAVETCVNEFVIDEQGRNIPSDGSKQREAKREVDGITWRFADLEGVDAKGKLANGNYWRYLGQYGESVRYYDVPVEAAAYFDGLLNKACFLDWR
jgi:hypothetical protein